jgi:hypothetical protein
MPVSVSMPKCGLREARRRQDPCLSTSHSAQLHPGTINHFAELDALNFRHASRSATLVLLAPAIDPTFQNAFSERWGPPCALEGAPFRNRPVAERKVADMVVWSYGNPPSAISASLVGSSL